MKRLPKLPFLQNIVMERRRQTGVPIYDYGYIEFLKTFGFAVPIRGDYLEFPDSFSDEDLTLFILRWS